MQPVNGYNIVDKVKLANQELFAIPQPNSPLPEQQKVSFKNDLVDFAEFSSSEAEDDELEDQTGTKLDEEEEEEENEDNENEEEDVKMSTEIDENIEEICEIIEDLSVDVPEEPIIDEDEDNLTDYLESSIDSKDVDSVVEVIITNPADYEVKPIQKVPSIDSTEVKQVKKPTKIIKPEENKNLKLNLNFRSCCEHKCSGNTKLPKYNGYYSQYGLSKEQLEKRETRIETYRKKDLLKKTKNLEEDSTKSKASEEAFARWLSNKMRNPRNRVRNMYDFKGKKHKKIKK